MAVDKNKIIAEATKLIQKGAYDKAIATYQKVLAEDPKDVRVLLKVGELQQKKGDDRAAAQAFEKVAETYAEQGFFLKSVAVYKQIVKLDPDDVRVNERLAGLYQQLGLMSDAMSQYQFMAAAYEKAGAGAKLTDVLKRMVELDPENIASSIKLGELYARSGQVGPALDCFRRAADYLKKQNRADEYLKVAERLAALSPDDLALTRELANIYLAKGDTKRALAKLQLCFKADPRDVETLQLLAHAFRDLGQTSKTVSVYKELARVHEEYGRPAEARAVWRKVQELAPDDEDASGALGTLPAAPPPRAAAPVGVPPGAARPPPAGPPPGIRGAVQPQVRGAPAPQAPAAPPAAGGADAIAKLLTETDVYVKYRLLDKALDHLRKVIALDTRCAEAHERAREIHVAAGRTQEAAAAGALAVRALVDRGQLDRARDAVMRLRQISPEFPELTALNAAVGGTEEVDLDAELEEEEEIVLSTGDVTEEAGEDEALALAAAGQGAAEEIVEEGERTDEALVEAAARASAESEEVVEEVVPRGPPARVTARPPAPAAAPPRPSAPPPAAAAPSAAEGEEVDLADEIEEADFFVQQGLLDDARNALENLLAFYPEHPVVRRKLQELEVRAAPAPRAPARADGHAVPAPGPSIEVEATDASFDIARELAELGGGETPAAQDDDFQYSVEDVFNQFKKGVEQTVKPEDSATHYDLGIAYKEMGLLDDAIHEFETALKGNDRKKEVDCLSMIGLCRAAKGEGREAITAFRRALASDHLTKDSAKAIHFEVAAAYEGTGDREGALYYFQRVVKVDPTFRDATKRVAALGGGPGRPPADELRARASGAAGRPGAPGRGAPPPAGAPKKNIGYL
jgi:tetratricopeptide (TPR) repeat protein